MFNLYAFVFAPFQTSYLPLPPRIQQFKKGRPPQQADNQGISASMETYPIDFNNLLCFWYGINKYMVFDEKKKI